MATNPISAWPQPEFRIPAPRPVPTLVRQPAATLTALEWSIVAMAEKDSVGSLREPGRFLSALRSVFGFRVQNRLANDRLETLRRIAVHAWRFSWDVPQSEIDGFVAAGFSLDQYELVQLSISKARSQARRAR